jgi:uncharacterized protein (TIGR03435 family)
LIFTAYDLELNRFQPPDWMGTTWLAIVAKVPAGTTREQFRKMQQNLWTNGSNWLFTGSRRK